MSINNLRRRVSRYKADNRVGMVLILDDTEALIKCCDERNSKCQETPKQVQCQKHVDVKRA